MDPQDLMLTALRASLLYFVLLIVVRILGKRSVGAIGAFDLVVALMLGEVVDEAIFGDVSMVKGLLAIGVIAAWHFVNEWASFRSKTIDKLTAGEPTVVVEAGEFKREGLARERINESEVLSQMRLQGIDKLQEVQCATVETNGHISFIQTEDAKTAQKGDLKRQPA
jgi:uncharacterized membrane protein YcaP (DUF421 family)